MDESTRERVGELHEHLAATAELPVDDDASKWLGEAEAVAEDAAGEAPPEVAVAKRVSQVRSLLGNVEETGDEEADEHLAAARELAKDLDRELDEFGVM